MIRDSRASGQSNLHLAVDSFQLMMKVVGIGMVTKIFFFFFFFFFFFNVTLESRSRN